MTSCRVEVGRAPAPVATTESVDVLAAFGSAFVRCEWQEMELLLKLREVHEKEALEAYGAELSACDTSMQAERAVQFAVPQQPRAAPLHTLAPGAPGRSP